MLLKPKKRKFKKHHLYKKPTNSKLKTHLVYAEYALVARQSSLLTADQIHSAVMTIKRVLKRKGKLWFRVFPHIPVTKKPLEVRMGKGKGAPEYFVAVVKPGRILFEVSGVTFDVAKEALRLAAQKLPVRTKFIIARDFE